MSAYTGCPNSANLYINYVRNEVDKILPRTREAMKLSIRECVC